MRFDRIEQAVVRGDVDCGVLIHEGRFKDQAKSLTLLEDLGGVWETRMSTRCRGGDEIRRDLVANTGANMDAALRASVESRRAPAASREYVARHAQEMDASVVAQHIQLYVNDYTLKLDERAVLALLNWQQDQGLSSAVPPSAPVFV